jgi:hypothetical protein
MLTIEAKSGTRAFFRTGRITGPDTYQNQQRELTLPPRPRGRHKYVMASRLPDGSGILTLNIDMASEGGYIEAKYFSEVTVTYLADDINSITDQNVVLLRPVPYKPFRGTRARA